MKTNRFENLLALVGVAVVLLGVSAAATTALAGDLPTVEIHGFATR